LKIRLFASWLPRGDTRGDTMVSMYLLGILLEGVLQKEYEVTLLMAMESITKYM
jgi:hypothetical protein